MRKPPQAPPPPNPIVQAMMAGKGKPQMGQPPMGMPPGAPMVKPGAKPPMMPMGGKGMPMPPAKGGGKPQGFAFGTRDVPPVPISPVPAPGQTITSGSWTGPQTPPPPQPMGGGQNSNLRSKMKANVPGFAGGTLDVPGAAQGYDAQSGSYPQLDDHFVAHLRAAMGMAPKGSVPAYAGGSPNVGNTPLPPGPNDFTMSGPSQQQDPAPMVPSPMDPGHGAAGFGRTANPTGMVAPTNIISQPPPMAPGAVGRAAGAPHPSQPAPAPQAPAQGGAAPPVNNQPPWLQALTQKPSGAERISGMLFGGGDQIKMRDATANFYSNPQVQQHLMDDPKSAALVQRDPHGAIPVLASYLDAVNSPSAGQITHMMPNGTVLQKTSDDPNKISVVSAGMGVDPHHAHLMMEPHQYSDDEWVNAAASMPMGTARKLWDMQHYLKPQETAFPAYVGGLQHKSAEAQAALDAAKKSGNTSAISKAQQVLDATTGETENFLRTLSLGGAWPAGMIGQQQPQ